MEKAGNVDSSTLEHFTNYKYAPTRATPLSVFALTNGSFASNNNGIINGEGRHAFNSTFVKGYAVPNSNMMVVAAQRPAYSTESEMTSMTSLSNQSARNTPPNINSKDTTQLPQAEE